MTLKYLILVAECVLISMRALVGMRGCFTEVGFDGFVVKSFLQSSSVLLKFQGFNTYDLLKQSTFYYSATF